MGKLLALLLWITRKLDQYFDYKADKEHEQKVQQYRDDPAGTFKSKFGRVQPSDGSSSDVRDAPDADKTGTGSDS